MVRVRHVLDFLGFWWSKGPNENVHIFHLVKWRGVKLETKIQWERLIHLREKKKREGNQRDFRILTRKRISECNSGFVHHWI